MNPTQLAGLVKRVYPNFDMTSFEDRLKLQKLVYLMQSCNLNLGYNFRLYLHGPYATQLARDGFDMPNMNKCPILKFEGYESENIFVDLENFLNNIKDNPREMEILGSLQLFHNLFPKKNDEDLINMVKEKSPSFNNEGERINKLLSKLKSFNRIRW
jgi:uncharacterized protein YwgA